MHDVISPVAHSLHRVVSPEITPSVAHHVDTIVQQGEEKNGELVRTLSTQFIVPTVGEIFQHLSANSIESAVSAITQHQKTLDAHEQSVSSDLLEALHEERIGREFFSERMKTLQIPAQRLREWWDILKTAQRREYIARTNATAKCPADIAALDLKSLAHKYLTEQKSESTSGSNQRGVFRIEGTDTLLVLRSPGTLEHQWALVGLTQHLGNTMNVPRTLRYEADDQYAYQVIERAEGIGCGSFAPSALDSIQYRHIRAFVATVQHLNDRGLLIDPSKASNVFYSARKGFSCIDLSYPDITQPQIGKPLQWQDPVLLYTALIGKNDTSLAPRLFSELSEAVGELSIES